MEQYGTAGIFLCPGWNTTLPRTVGGSGGRLRQMLREELERRGVILGPETYYGAMTYAERGSRGTAIRQEEINAAADTFYIGIYHPAEDVWELYILDRTHLQTDRERKFISANALSLSSPLVDRAATERLRGCHV